jgi:hypothetical protein
VRDGKFMSMKSKRRALPLLVKYTFKGKFVGATQVKAGQFSIGSSMKNAVRLPSKEIAGICCHAEFGDSGWVVNDLGSQPNVKINGKAFIEHNLTENTLLEVGEHHLEIIPFKRRRPLFLKDIDPAQSRKLTVIRINNHILSTHTDQSEVEELKRIAEETLDIEEIYIPLEATYKIEKVRLPTEVKKPLAITALSVFIFLVIIFGLPIPKEDTVVKPQDNVYTRMIFDKNVLSQKKKELASFGPRNPHGTGAGNGSISEGAKGAQSKVMKAVASLRQAGVSSVISKIAARASINAKLIASLAGTPEANAAIDHGEGAVPVPSSGAATGGIGIMQNSKGFKIGGIGTTGKGGGTGGYKAGAGLGTGNAGNGEVGLEDTESVVEGGLDREVIAGIIREHLGQVRYCYERQLAANPDLYGKLKIRFTINSDGVVDSQLVSQTTMKSAMVEDCILRRIATWKFPKPKGGTKVIVSYPFLFKSVN